MQRFSTVAALDMQLKIVEPVFDKIYSAIFDTTKPIRTSRLSGIQLVDNLNPKEKKSKGKADSPPENSTSPPATVETADLDANKPDNENTSFENTQPEDTGDNEKE